MCRLLLTGRVANDTYSRIHECIMKYKFKFIHRSPKMRETEFNAQVAKVTANKKVDRSSRDEHDSLKPEGEHFLTHYCSLDLPRFQCQDGVLTCWIHVLIMGQFPFLTYV